MQDSLLITVTEKHELIALHRALFEAQFAAAPHDKDVPGSPLLASLANRVIDALAEDDPRWRDWRMASQHPERVEIVRERLPSDPRWKGMLQSEREAHVRNHLAPLVPDEALLADLIGSAA